MALLYIDSFDHYNASSEKQKWTDAGLTITTGRHGNGVVGSMQIGLNPAPTSTRAIVGLAFKSSTSGSAFSVGIFDPTAGSIGHHFGFSKPISIQDGSIAITSRSGTFHSAAGLIRFNGQWNYIELDGTIDDSAGEVKLILNGTTILHETGIDTKSSFGDLPSPFWREVQINAVAFTIDDLYILDGAGSTNNAPLGDVEIVALRANAQPNAGDNAEWTPSPTVPNWQNIDDNVPDNDATYNYATIAQIGAKDLFHIEDAGVSDEIIGAQFLISARRTEEGFAKIRGVVKQDGVEYDTPDVTLAQDYQYSVRTTYDVAPDGTAWTASKFNNMQFGYKRTT